MNPDSAQSWNTRSIIILEIATSARRSPISCCSRNVSDIAGSTHMDYPRFSVDWAHLAHGVRLLSLSDVSPTRVRFFTTCSPSCSRAHECVFIQKFRRAFLVTRAFHLSEFLGVIPGFVFYYILKRIRFLPGTFLISRCVGIGFVVRAPSFFFRPTFDSHSPNS
ncbi:hypothetical protein C8R45DRAFT_300844 [Mycena sanguinolenta]|nr:hypothetical protein C8R45DRAFT_300844 [Mycena sanguinolenta]